MPIIGGRQASVRGLGFQGAGAPAQVTGLTATDFGTNRAYNDGRIDLSWSAPANNGAPITGYRIDRGFSPVSFTTLVANTGTTSTTYQDTGLTSETNYFYRVYAINSVGLGVESSPADATATTVPQAPTIGTVTRTNNTTVSIPFTAGATGGKTITSYTTVSSPSISLSTSGTTTPLSATGTFAQTTSYTFTIAAVNANGTSVASASSNSVTPYPVATVTGGTLTSDATYYYRTFTGSGTLGITGASLNADVLIVAGGAGGGSSGTFNVAFTGNRGTVYGGGGGAGGVVYLPNQTLSIANHSVTVGGGGGSSADGTNSSLGALTAAVGGGRPSNSGGSGGGGSWSNSINCGVQYDGGGTATSGQGFNGASAGSNTAGGGGGAGSAGTRPAAGSGTSAYSTWSSVTGTGTTNNLYSIGGPGQSGTVPTGGGLRSNSGNGGRGASSTTVSRLCNPGGSGSSGVVIVRYLKSEVGG